MSDTWTRPTLHSGASSLPEAHVSGLDPTGTPPIGTTKPAHRNPYQYLNPQPYFVSSNPRRSSSDSRLQKSSKDLIFATIPAPVVAPCEIVKDTLAVHCLHAEVERQSQIRDQVHHWFESSQLAYGTRTSMWILTSTAPTPVHCPWVLGSADILKGRRSPVRLLCLRPLQSFLWSRAQRRGLRSIRSRAHRSPAPARIHVGKPR